MVGTSNQSVKLGAIEVTTATHNATYSTGPFLAKMMIPFKISEKKSCAFEFRSSAVNEGKHDMNTHIDMFVFLILMESRQFTCPESRSLLFCLVKFLDSPQP